MDREIVETTPVFDAEDLLARCLGNFEFAQRVLAVFRQRCDEDLAELERAVAARDTEAVACIAHRLQGASANAAALGLRVRAWEMEHAARQRRLGEIADHFTALRQEWDRFTSELSLLGGWSESAA